MWLLKEDWLWSDADICTYRLNRYHLDSKPGSRRLISHHISTPILYTQMHIYIYICVCVCVFKSVYSAWAIPSICRGILPILLIDSSCERRHESRLCYGAFVMESRTLGDGLLGALLERIAT